MACFLYAFGKITRCKTEVYLTVENSDTSILEVSEYIQHFVSLHPTLRIFQDSLPSLEKKYLIYHIANETDRDIAIQNKHLLEEFLKNVASNWQLRLKK